MYRICAVFLSFFSTPSPRFAQQDGGELTSHLDAGPSLRAALAVVDCGVRELKGIALPEHVYQVAPKRLDTRHFGPSAAAVAVPSSAAASAAATPIAAAAAAAVAFGVNPPVALSALSKTFSADEEDRSALEPTTPGGGVVPAPPPRGTPPAASAAASAAASGREAGVGAGGGALASLRQPTPLAHGKEGGAAGKLGVVHGSKGQRDPGSDPTTTWAAGRAFDVYLCHHPPDARALCVALQEARNLPARFDFGLLLPSVRASAPLALVRFCLANVGAPLLAQTWVHTRGFPRRRRSNRRATASPRSRLMAWGLRHAATAAKTLRHMTRSKLRSKR
jgi:hypothetical protein